MIKELTPEEVRNNYEYKIARRTLLNEFDWIKDVTFDDNDINQYSILFLTIIVDPDIIKERYGYELNFWVSHYLSKGESYASTEGNIIFKMGMSESSELFKEPLNKLLDRIHSSPALPDELKIPDRTIRVFRIMVLPDNTSGG